MRENKHKNSGHVTLNAIQHNLRLTTYAQLTTTTTTTQKLFAASLLWCLQLQKCRACFQFNLKLPCLCSKSNWKFCSLLVEETT